ncbi:MAG: O-antigen ligase family protein, partial [Pseudomonadota bacterium]
LAGAGMAPPGPLRVEPDQRGTRFHVSKSLLASLMVGLALILSSFVLFEPAPVDAVLFGLIIALPLLAQTRPGPISGLICALWIAIVALGFIAAPLSSEFQNAIKHLVITLYLAVAAYVLAGYISAKPVERIALFMRAYTLGCLIASGLALIGFFSLLPGAYDLFTNFGRAKGPFKDPNVLGAAIAPAFVWLTWKALTSPPRQATWALAGASFIGLAILLSFSRGAWASVVVSFAFLAIFLMAGATTPRKQVRLLAAVAAAAILLPLTLMVALQFEAVQTLAEVRFRLDQSYDSGPEGRFGGQAKAVDLILSNPFGIGVFGFTRYHAEEPHNVYLLQFLNGGWLGGAFYIIAIALTLAAGLTVAMRPGPLQVPQILMVSAFLGMVAEGFIIDTDHWRHFFIIQAGVVGLADGNRRLRAAAARSGQSVTAAADVRSGAQPRGTKTQRPVPAAPPLAPSAPHRRPARPAPHVLPPRPVAPLHPAASAEEHARLPRTWPAADFASKPLLVRLPLPFVARADNDAVIENRLAHRLGRPTPPAGPASVSLTPRRLAARIEKPGPMELADARSPERSRRSLAARLLDPGPIEAAAAGEPAAKRRHAG